MGEKEYQFRSCHGDPVRFIKVRMEGVRPATTVAGFLPES